MITCHMQRSRASNSKQYYACYYVLTSLQLITCGFVYTAIYDSARKRIYANTGTAWIHYAIWVRYALPTHLLRVPLLIAPLACNSYSSTSCGSLSLQCMQWLIIAIYSYHRPADQTRDYNYKILATPPRQCINESDLAFL